MSLSLFSCWEFVSVHIVLTAALASTICLTREAAREQSRLLTAEVADVLPWRLASTILQHVAGVNVQLRFGIQNQAVLFFTPQHASCS